MRCTPTVIILAVFALMLVPACGSSSSPAPSLGPAPIVDLIATSRNGDAVVMFKDILNGHALVGADVVLDGTGPETLDNGGRIAYENGWLAVSCRDDDKIVLYSDAPNLVDQQAPSAVLPLGTDGRGCTIVGGDLYACCGNEVRIWRDVSTVMNSDAPDAVLTGIDRASDVLVYMDNLFAASRNNDRVYRYAGASTLAGGEAPAGEAVIDGPRRLHMHDGVLWMSDRNDNSAVLGFSDPVNLVNGTQADQYIFGLFQMDGSRSIAFDGDNAWIANRYDQNGVVLNRVQLSNPTVATVVITEDDSPFSGAYDVKLIAGVLFLSAQSSGAVYWWRNPAGMASGQAPDGYVFDPRLNNGKMIVGWERMAP